MDVVPVGDTSSWSEEPFGGAIVDGRLCGRATDMKGGVAAALFATKVALESGLRPQGDVFFHLVSDEEVVGNGTREIVAKAPAPDVAVSVEPTELDLCCAEGGLVHFRLEVEGVEAHASTRYLSIHAGGTGRGGVNAIEKTLKVVAALQSSSGNGRTAVAPSFRPGSTRCFPGSSSAGRGRQGGPAEPLLQPRDDAELLRGRVQPLVLPLRDVRRRPCRGRGACLPPRAPTLAERHPPRLSWKIEAHLLPAARRAPRPSGRGDDVGVPPGYRAQTLTEGSEPPPTSPGTRREASRSHLRPGALEQCHVADEYIETDVDGQGVRAPARAPARDVTEALTAAGARRRARAATRGARDQVGDRHRSR